ncbi:hypothetical protein FACS189430_04280 [Bacteroidia bacterium]|nr:hypothetical protein FACS189430_04280 [Bacteroidia bacterium]
MNMSSEKVMVSSTQTAMSVGAATGCLMLLSSVLPLAQLLGICVFTGGVYYGVRLFRNRSEAFSYGQLFWAGLQTAFFTSVIMAFVVFVTAKVINPAILTAYVEAIEKMLHASELPTALAAQTMEQARELISPVFLAFAVVCTYTLLGAIAALICSLILNRSNLQPDTP